MHTLLLLLLLLFTSLPALNNTLSINSLTDTSILFNNRARTPLSLQLHPSAHPSLHHPTRRRPITKLYPTFCAATNQSLSLRSLRRRTHFAVKGEFALITYTYTKTSFSHSFANYRLIGHHMRFKGLPVKTQN